MTFLSFHHHLRLSLFLSLHFGHEPKPYLFATLVSLQLRSISSFVFYHSLTLTTLSVPSQANSDVVDSTLGGWKKAASNPVSGENACSWPPQPTNKGGLGLEPVALFDPLTALTGPAKA